MVPGNLLPWVKWKLKEECTKEKLGVSLKCCKTNSSKWQFKSLYSKDIQFCFYGFWTGCMLTHRLHYKTKWTTQTNTLLLDSRLQGTPSRWVPCITWAIEMFVDTLRSFFFGQTARNTWKHWMLSYIFNQLLSSVNLGKVVLVITLGRITSFTASSSRSTLSAVLLNLISDKLQYLFWSWALLDKPLASLLDANTIPSSLALAKLLSIPA